jgi:plastocyanin
MTRRVLTLLLAVLVVALGAAACGGDDDGNGNGGAGAGGGGGGGGGNGAEITLAADPGGDLAFDQTSLTASAGSVTITFTNESGIPHNVGIEGNGVDEISETITEGSTDLTVDLEPGEYTFYCGVGGHRAGGMEGTLTVE